MTGLITGRSRQRGKLVTKGKKKGKVLTLSSKKIRAFREDLFATTLWDRMCPWIAEVPLSTHPKLLRVH